MSPGMLAGWLDGGLAGWQPAGQGGWRAGRGGERSGGAESAGEGVLGSARAEREGGRRRAVVVVAGFGGGGGKFRASAYVGEIACTPKMISALTVP